MSGRTKVSEALAEIGDLPRANLVERWRKAYGCPPPKGIKRGLLERATSWHLQARHFGGPSTETRKKLKQAINRLATMGLLQTDGANNLPCQSGSADGNITIRRRKPVTTPVSSPAPPAGSRLLREWNGRMHIVEVTEGGFVLDGRTYRSLSAVARRITGAHWSGPRFFGL